MTTILYCRVSTADQTIAHQRTQAEAHGYKIDQLVSDEGVSGVSTRLGDRPEGRRVFDLLRSGDTLVVRWIDRLGRNYGDVCETLRILMDRGIIVRTIIHGMVFDGSAATPMEKAVRDALIGFMAATAQAQAEATKEAQRAGIAHAQARDTSYRGRKPSYCRAKFGAARMMLSQDASISTVSRETGLSRQTVYRIRDDAAGAEAALSAWGL